MGFSKPSISHAVSVLRDGGFLTMDENGFLHLTDIGQEVAKKIYERHQFFIDQLIAAGVDRETGETVTRPGTSNPTALLVFLKGFRLFAERDKFFDLCFAFRITLAGLQIYDRAGVHTEAFS